MKTIKLMFVDDQKLFVESLTHILKKVERSIRVVSYALNGSEAVEIVEKEIPDVIMMDIRMPIMNGVEAVKIIHRMHPAIKIIMLTTYDDDEYVKDALRYGASGYLLKDIPIDDLISQIKSVCYGNVSPLSKSVFEKLTHTIEDSGISGPPSWLDAMNRNEKRVLKLMIEGENNDEIAAFGLPFRADVKNYVHGIYGKLGIHSRAEAIKIGRGSQRFLDQASGKY